MNVPRSKVSFRELMRTAMTGLRTRSARVAFTASGIAIGIAALVAVVGVSQSSKADLLHELDELGTNLLAVRPGQSMYGESATLPEEAPSMIRRIPPVMTASATSFVDASVRRSEYIPTFETGGIAVMAVERNLLDLVDGELVAGRFLNEVDTVLPTVVLGSVAAERLGLDSLEEHPLVSIDGIDFTVVGILDSLRLHPDLDRSVFITYEIAASRFGTKSDPGIIYLRVVPEHVTAVHGVLAGTANPGNPGEVEVSKPSDALEARALVDEGLTRLLLGLGIVAVIVGGLGVANIMVVSVLERRLEIGTRRALGAGKRHIAAQFLVESALMSAIGGIGGLALGVGATALYATQQGWLVSVPTTVLVAGFGLSVVIGILAGVQPAVRAAGIDPAEAVRPRA